MFDLTRLAVCATLAISLVCAALRAWRKHIPASRLRHPPGPRGLPLIGNVLDLNIAKPWLSYEEWGKRYGGIVYSNLLGQDCIIINDEGIAHELLERRSSIYSDRPYISTNTLFGMDFNTVLLPYGNEWKLHRKMYNTAFNQRASAEYVPMQIHKVHQLLQNLLVAPQNYFRHFETLSGAIVMSITYGYDAASDDDPFVTKIMRLVNLIVAVLTPERAALLGAIPFLAHIPSWFPGGRYKQRAGECRALARQVLDEPFQYTKDTIAVGSARKSLVHDLLSSEKDAGQGQEDAVKAVAATGYVAGAETTFSVLLTFMLAMVLHPDVQAKAQEEIDRVVGQDRLPDFSDRTNLPYVEGVFLETLRWRPVVPLSIPRMTMEDDVFDGMYIPKGAMVLTNVWAMTQNQVRFPKPSAFMPERHISPDGKFADASKSPAFGFGRRICPGRHVAAQSVWAAVVSVLATLEIRKARDALGREIDVRAEFTTGLAIHPKPFPCEIVPRSWKTEQLIHASGCNK